MATEQTNGTAVLFFLLGKSIALLEGASILRDDFLGQHITRHLGCLGIFEGELLSEQAHEKGYETESWVLDSGLAPHARDWIASEEVIQVSAYFSTQAQVESVKDYLKQSLAFMKPMFVDTAYEAVFTVKEINTEKHRATIETTIIDKTTGALCTSGEATVMNINRI